MAEKLGIIAGNGKYPVLLARNARAAGMEVVAVALREETDPAIEEAADRTTWISLTQLGKLIETFRREGITRAVMAGQVVKRRMYLGDLFRLDATALRLWRGLPDKRGETILRAVADELGRHGIALADATLFMEPYLAVPGVMTRRRPTPEQEADVEFGLVMAKVVAEHDIGQSVCVKDRSVVAVEAVEGTDACVLRAGELSGGGFALVKVSRRGHDMRFDVPVVGLGTLRSLAAAKAAVLAVEAGRTLMFDREEFLAGCDGAGIAVVGVEAREEG